MRLIPRFAVENIMLELWRVHVESRRQTVVRSTAVIPLWAVASEDERSSCCRRQIDSFGQ